MKREQMPVPDSQSEPQIPEQLDIDFEAATKRAAIEEKAKEIRKRENITMPYARDVASVELTMERLREKAKQKKKPN